MMKFIGHRSTKQYSDKQTDRLIDRYNKNQLSNPVVTFLIYYRLPIVIGLSLADFAVLLLIKCHGRDRWNWSSEKRHYAL